MCDYLTTVHKWHKKEQLQKWPYCQNTLCLASCSLLLFLCILVYNHCFCLEFVDLGQVICHFQTWYVYPMAKHGLMKCGKLIYKWQARVSMFVMVPSVDLQQGSLWKTHRHHFTVDMYSSPALPFSSPRVSLRSMKTSKSTISVCKPWTSEAQEV